VNIDETDNDNELAALDYIDDIYEFYKNTEVMFYVFSLFISSSSLTCVLVIMYLILMKQKDGCVHDYMGSQPDINAKMRSILVDWLIEVHRKFELMPETLYLTMNIVDRFLSVKAVPRRELQLVGISSMLLASKYEEIWAPEVEFCEYYTVLREQFFEKTTYGVFLMFACRLMTLCAYQTMLMSVHKC